MTGAPRMDHVTVFRTDAATVSFGRYALGLRPRAVSTTNTIMDLMLSLMKLELVSDVYVRSAPHVGAYLVSVQVAPPGGG